LIKTKKDKAKSLNARKKPDVSSSSAGGDPEEVFLPQQNGSVEKQRRAAHNERKSQWRWEVDAAPREDFTEQLQATMRRYFAPSVVDGLFDEGRVERQILAMRRISAAVRSSGENPHGSGIVANVMDLVLKWCSLRLCWMDHVKATSQLIVLLDDVMSFVVAAQSMQLSEYEASVILPFLVEKLGSGKERFRVGFRGCLRKFWSAHPPAKVAEHVLAGMQGTDNTRTHVQCLEALSEIVAEHGWRAIGRKGVRAMGKDVDHSKKDIRVAALSALVPVWEALDCSEASLLKILGSIKDKQAVMIKEKLKHAAKAKGRVGTTAASGRAQKPRASPARSGIRTRSARVASPARRDKGTPPRNTIRGRGGRRQVPSNEGGAGPVKADAASGGLGPAVATPSPNVVPRRGGHTHLFARRAVQMSPDGPDDDVLSDPSAVPRNVVASAGRRAGAAAVGSATNGPAAARAAKAGRTKTVAADTMLTTALKHLGALAAAFEETNGAGRASLAAGDSLVYNQGVVAMKMVHKMSMLCEKAAAPEYSEETATLLAAHADELVQRLTSCAVASFADDPVEFRTLSLTLSTLMALFAVKTAAAAVRTSSARSWFAFAVATLLDPRLPKAIAASKDVNYKNMNRAFNYLTIRVAERSNPTVTFVAVLQLLGECAAGTAQRAAGAMPPQAERVLAKIMHKVCTGEARRARSGEAFGRVDVASVLREVDAVLELVGRQPGSPVGRAATRTALKLVQEIAGARPAAARSAAGGMPAGSAAAASVHAALEDARTSASEVERAAPAGPAAQASEPAAGSAQPGPSGWGEQAGPAGKDSEEAARAHRELSAIFLKISTSQSKASSKAAVEELFAFKTAHPKMNIEATLKRASVTSYFQDFILAELGALERRSKAARATAPADSAAADDPVRTRMLAMRSRFAKSAGDGGAAPESTGSIGGGSGLAAMRAKLEGLKMAQKTTETEGTLSDFRARLAKYSRETSNDSA
jgi:hypothetical protein